LKTRKSFYSFVKFLLYTAFFLAGTQIVGAGTLKLDWQVFATAVVVGCVKAAMTWWSTEDMVCR
jgi:hypothetical protein